MNIGYAPVVPRDTFPCPKCNRTLRRSGELSVDGQVVPLDVFQCDECLGKWKVGNSEFDVAFTFVVNSEGVPLDNLTFQPLR